MLELPREMVDQILAHARRDHPDECCGVIAGKAGLPTRLFEMDNADRSPTGFSFDSAQWLTVYRQIDDADEQQLVVYHSHTATEGYPSRTDALWSTNTEFEHWLVVSTRSDEDEVRSFTITDGVIVEEQLTIT